MKDTAGYRDFMAFWNHSAEVFRKGDQKEAMRIFADGLFGANYFEGLPPAASATMMQNSRAIEALALSKNPFPYLPKDKVINLQIPTLVLTGDNTIRIHRQVDDELVRLLGNAKHIIVPNSGHAIARDSPELYRSTVLRFLNEQK
jgi:pimeloyl-ACP methyl ester carboxylesterase